MGLDGRELGVGVGMMAKARTFVVVGVVLIGLGLWGVASTIPYKEPRRGPSFTTPIMGPPSWRGS